MLGRDACVTVSALMLHKTPGGVLLINTVGYSKANLVLYRFNSCGADLFFEVNDFVKI